MAKTKLTILKPVLGVLGMSDADLLSHLNAVHDHMLNNPAYPSPPVDMAGFKAAIEAYTAGEAAARDGGKAAIVQREKRRADAIIMYRLLGHYVEAACKNDLTTFTSSGFVLATTGQKTPPQPVDVPSIVAVDQGSTGQLLVSIKPVKKARSYDIRYAPEPAPGAPINWIMISVPSTKPATAVNNLAKGVNYVFQARAFGKLGFSDWSSSVDRMCI